MTQTDATKRAAVQVLYEALDVNGILVLIDNGSPIGSHSVRTARQFLLDMFNTTSSSDRVSDKEGEAVSASPRMYGKTAEVQYVLPPPTDPATQKPYRYEDFTVKVLAPCTHDKVCPLKPGAWCSFKQKTQVGGWVQICCVLRL
jgi:ribosomal protein RSM22 (predicted rRNA methylase)